MSWRDSIKEDNSAGWRSTIKEETPTVTELESGLIGAGEGASLGFMDEALGAAVNPVGAAKTLANKFGGEFNDKDVEEYLKWRDATRKVSKTAEEANPKSFMAGNLGGGIATSLLIPGSGITNLAAQGAAQGIGSSEGDTAVDLAIAGGAGAGIGAIAGKGGELLEQGVTKVGPMIKEGLESIGGKATSTIGKGIESTAKGALTKVGGLAPQEASVIAEGFGEPTAMKIREALYKNDKKSFIEGLRNMGGLDQYSDEAVGMVFDKLKAKMLKEPEFNPLTEIGKFGGLEYLVPGLGKVYAAGKGAETIYRTAKSPQKVAGVMLGAEKAIGKASQMSAETLNTIAPKLGKFSKILIDAAKRGGTSLGAKHFILQQTSPEYQELFKKATEDPNEAERE